MEKKLVVVFPGVGYHSDKPLLYYTKKIAKNYDYEIREVKYDIAEFKSSREFDAKKAMAALDAAFLQVDKTLKDINFEQYDRVIFVGKSIGTALMAKYAMTYEIDAEMIVYTPIPETFAFLGACEGLIFHGSADPLCDTEMLEQLCDQMSLTYAIIPNANHSLETGDVVEDIRNLSRVMQAVDRIFKL
ncbi:alpha/beta hydrolase [Pseudobutyrivibrio sp.]|uniref:alpha/beta hydrolase n=1 Tax=Pseudobutyrivibrio sp. TaxID=2014367 RepID=UPI001D8295A6|nr:alpha/beta hydrolase [Pseudobutyrivibrio sp.]MBE5910684.1 alpha/beta hydrolase [Pseudobutyrivibrio sp.]